MTNSLRPEEPFESFIHKLPTIIANKGFHWIPCLLFHECNKINNPLRSLAFLLEKVYNPKACGMILDNEIELSTTQRFAWEPSSKIRINLLAYQSIVLAQSLMILFSISILPMLSGQCAAEVA